mmetsp:Transcript_7098/g.13437  ORF Transcript_7098/g.13437 Transcript_7098/m.13437 type:complete len:800 (+) Transcript_7098:54-2453(+)|eukprot:CAMPEP_0175134838 /NCGR_PEP_ID=MMETSP0087-20121206/8392_1 /TAXON_ID=136419 /ORGANISM="Unknown Unknown, Strain D1" /LENGTH=799 /DNA_ID=CAMNT_0016417427 /DNA_START=34 /DNA_END=2433 /DNA_ORIENTATION=+
MDVRALSADFQRFTLGPNNQVQKSPVHIFARYHQNNQGGSDLYIHWCPVDEPETEIPGQSICSKHIKQMVVGRSAKVFYLDKTDPDTCLSLCTVDTQLYLKTKSSAVLVAWFKELHKVLLASGRKHATVQKKYEPEQENTIVEGSTLVPAAPKHPLDHYLNTVTDIVRSTFGFPTFVDVNVPHDMQIKKVPQEVFGKFSFLAQGMVVKKLSHSTGKMNKRFVIFDAELCAISWRSLEETACTKCLPLVSLTDVYLGLSSTSFKNFSNKSSLRPECCFSLHTTDKTFDIEVDTPDNRKLWVDALQSSLKFDSVFSSQLDSVHTLNSAMLSMLGYGVHAPQMEDNGMWKLQSALSAKHQINELLWHDLHKLQTMAYVIYTTSVTHPEVQQNESTIPPRPPSTFHGLIDWMESNIGDVFAEQSRLCMVIDGLAKQQLQQLSSAAPASSSAAGTGVSEQELNDIVSDSAAKMLVLTRRVSEAENRAASAEQRLLDVSGGAPPSPTDPTQLLLMTKRLAEAEAKAVALEQELSSSSDNRQQQVLLERLQAAETRADQAEKQLRATSVLNVTGEGAGGTHTAYRELYDQHGALLENCQKMQDEIKKLNSTIIKQQQDAARQQSLMASMKKMQLRSSVGTPAKPTPSSSTTPAPASNETPSTTSSRYTTPTTTAPHQTLSSEERIKQLKRERLALRSSVASRTARFKGGSAETSPSKSPSTSTKKSSSKKKSSTTKPRRKKTRLEVEKAKLEASLKSQEARIKYLKQQKVALEEQKRRAARVAELAYAAASSSSSSETTDDDVPTD